MLYICTKFHENISKGFRVTELTQFLISKFSKRHRFVENIGGVMILVLNTFSDHALEPGRVAQSVVHLTRKSGVLGSIPGLATYFRFSFRFFKKGSCQLLAKVCARSTD